MDPITPYPKKKKTSEPNTEEKIMSLALKHFQSHLIQMEESTMLLQHASRTLVMKGVGKIFA